MRFQLTDGMTANLDQSDENLGGQKMRSIMVAAVAALALAGAGLGFGNAEASKPCVTPGTGLQIGAKNMILSPMMLEIMAEHTAPQGDAGMATAVGNSSAGCS